MTNKNGKSKPLECKDEYGPLTFLKKYEKYHESQKRKKLSNSRKKYMPSELKSFKKDDAYLIFSANGNYITPSDFKVQSSSSFHEKKNINYPVGSCKYMTTHSLGNSFDPFVFANIKRENENKLYKQYINIYDKNKIPANSRNRNSYNEYTDRFNGYNNINFEKEISKEDLKGLEKMLWYRSKPRLEKPYRIIADQKNCVKNCSTISNIVRRGM